MGCARGGVVRTEDMVSDLYLCGFVCPRACDVQRVCRAVTARVACRVRRGGGIRSGSGPVGGTVAGARLRG